MKELDNRVGFIICCYNSRHRLLDTLTHLSRQARAEVAILVDNASTDGTAESARKMWDRLGSPFPFVVVHEPQPGLVHARRRGFSEAEARDLTVVCFVDDDNRLLGNWVDILDSLFMENELVGAVGGRGVAQFEKSEPVWFSAHQGAFACGPQGSPGLVSVHRGYLYGAGLAVRMKAWISIKKNFRPVLTGRSGGKMLAGDDAELCLAIQKGGWQLWYEPRLEFIHFMPDARLTLDAVSAMHFGFGVSSRILGKLKSDLSGGWVSCCLFRFQFLYRTYARAKYIIKIVMGINPKSYPGEIFRLHEIRGCMEAL